MLADPARHHLKIAEDRHQQVIEVVRQPARQLAEAVELLHLMHLRQRLLALGGALLDAPLQLGIGFGQLGSAFLHAALEFGVEPLEIARLAVELGENTDLGAQQLRHHRHRHVIGCAVLVAFDAIEIGHRDRRDENDCCRLEARMLADHGRELETVELGHANIDQHDGDLVLQKQREGLARRIRLEEILVKLGENHLIGQELGRLVIDQQNVDFIVLRHDVPIISAMEPHPQRGKKLFRVHRLREIVRGPRFEAFLAVAFHGFRGERDDR